MHSYSLSSYSGMLSDPVRVAAYEAALQRVIGRDTTVVEIGTGSGFFAVLACKLGARRVHAIEPDDSIQVAREMARVNGVDDRITFHQELSTRVELPAPADVMFSDLRGILPLWEHHVATIRDARTRLLRPGGVQIPLRDRIWAAPVEAAELYGDRTHPWGENHRELDLGPATRHLANNFTKARVKPEQLLAEPALWAELDWTSIEEPGVSGTLSWDVEEPRQAPSDSGGSPTRLAHGLAAWFDTDLLPDIGFSNAPDEPEALYGHAFFPFSEPIPCAPGDRLEVDLRAHLVGENYVWEWRTRRPATGDRAEVRFRQSTLNAVPLSPERFMRGGESYVPRLGADGESEVFILRAMDGTATVKEIARRAQAAFPESFPTYRHALNRVSALSRERSR